MADAYQAQAANPAAYEGMPFEDRFAMCVDAECDKRATSKLDRLIKDARFRFPDASPEGFDFSANRQLDRPQIARLFECRFIDEGRDVIITGVTGTGKTWLSCAIGKAACRRHKTVRYIRLPAFFSDLACAKEAGRYDKALAKYVRYNLLILDDWLLYKCSKDEQHDIYELIEARDHLSPTIFCSQFSEDGWLQRLGKVPSSEGALARITKAGVIKVAFSTASDMRNQHSLVKDSANE
jgi:DNA replication protein DnaC